jgi:hypothetical protein
MYQDRKPKHELTVEERLARLGVEAIWDGADHFTFGPLLHKNEQGAESVPLPVRLSQP